jgi:beta-N-acetylhexosaminidase
LGNRTRIFRRYQLGLAALLAVALGGIAVLVVLGRDEPDRTGLKGAERPRPPSAGGSILARLIPPPGGALPGARVSVQIARRVRSLPLERRVAQLLLVGFEGQAPSAPALRRIARSGFGGVALEERNYIGTAQLRALAVEPVLLAASRRVDPPLVMAPQLGGEFNAFANLPPKSAPADLRTVAKARAEARAAGRRLRQLGLSGVLGPVIDVGPEDGGAVGARAYSDDPEAVADFATATVEAYRRERILAAPAHFPGVGGASQPLEQGPAEVGLSLDELMKRDIVPFRAAIGAGARAVVLGHAGYVTDDFVVPGSTSRAIATDLLRGRLGFRGVAITDDLAKGAVTAVASIPNAAVRAIAAGADMVWISGSPADQQAALRAIVRAVRQRKIPRRRIDGAATRVLTLKRELGLVRGRRPR